MGESEIYEDDIKLKNLITHLFDANYVNEVSYNRWTHTDRSNLETIVKSTDEFIDELVRSLHKYQRHAFITKMQSSAYKEAKEGLVEGEMVVVCDFAENYSFVVQVKMSYVHNNLFVCLMLGAGIPQDVKIFFFSG